MTDPRIDHYDWEGGREAMLRFGPADGPLVIAALPLFEEANRTRAFMVAILRALADRGIGGVLPDLPGQGESLRTTADVGVLDMQLAYEAAVAHAGGAPRAFGIGLRSGALLDALGLLAGRWHLAPQGGPDLLRELRRVRQAHTGERLAADLWWLDGLKRHGDAHPPVAIAGNAISTALLTELTVKQPFGAPDIARRVVRLTSDAAKADLRVDGAPLWRRAEPDNDPALVQILADDIAHWIAACEA